MIECGRCKCLRGFGRLEGEISVDDKLNAQIVSAVALLETVRRELMLGNDDLPGELRRSRARELQSLVEALRYTLAANDNSFGMITGAELGLLDELVPLLPERQASELRAVRTAIRHAMISVQSGHKRK